MSLYGKILQVCNRSVTIERVINEITIKENNNFLISLFIYIWYSNTTTPKQQVKADDGYNGKIFRHWCKLRASKSKRSKVLKRLEIGTPVTVYSTSGKWRKVSVNGKTGYVLKKYVYINTDAPALEGTTYDKGQTVAQFAQRFVETPTYGVEQT